MLCNKVVEGLPPAMLIWLNRNFTPPPETASYRDDFGQMTRNVKAALNKWSQVRSGTQAHH